MEDSFKQVIDLLYLAKQDGVEVVLKEERLQIKIADDKSIDENLLREIRDNKQLIINYLSNDNWKSKVVAKNQPEIGRFNREDIPKIPLSFSQERLWFIDQLEGSVQYHSPSVLRLKGNLDKEALARSLKMVIDRHEILKTIFHEENGNVFQSVKLNDDWHLPIIEGHKYKSDTSGLKLYIESLVKAPFDLSQDYPVRGSLLCLSDTEFILIVTMHHIVSDAWSVSIIVNEVVELYNAFLEGREPQLAALPLQYADYAVWQRNYLQGEILDKKIAYWKQKLEDILPLQLPTDFTRPPVKGAKGASASFSIDKSLLLQLHELSRQQGASLFMVLLAAFKVLLYRYSGQQDISVGTSIASRQQKELEGLVGFFVNTICLRDKVIAGASFTELIQQVKTTTLEAYQHQELPFEKVVEAVVHERDASRSPLFQVMLVLANTPESSKLKLGEVALSVEPVATRVSKFDLTFFMSETVNGLNGTIEYSTDLFKADTIKRMTAHFEMLLNSVVKDPKQKIGLFTMIGKEESQLLLEAFNNCKVDYPIEKSITTIFEEQVEKTPNSAALVFGDESLTYRQLNKRSNQLAHHLISRGVKPGSLVPLYMERSAEMLIAIMGIMKAGAAYVPIDTDFPSDRISYMLHDTGATFVVCSIESSKKIPIAVERNIIVIDGEALLKEPVINLATKPLPNQLAYVIYTSGSTGMPKGVMIEHRSLVDYYYGLSKHTDVDHCRSFALVSTIATDLGNTVIYASLLSGGTLHVFTKESISDIEYLHNYFSRHTIDCLKIVPSHWQALATTTTLLLPKRLLIFGGESLQTGLIESIRLSGTQCRVVNHYGPTETTIGKLLHEVNLSSQYDKAIPVGKPFSNTVVYILSAEMQPCPIGIPGQLYIGGEGVARGYHNNPELTNEKFIDSPFSKQAGAKIYATGDQVKWLPDGDITFIGRVDDQVKIRGYRIELGEIEAALLQCEAISQAVVLADDDKRGNKRLVCYIVPKDSFDKETINKYLKEKLPDYMIPSVLLELESLPLTTNGKINRKALPDPDADDLSGGNYVAPRNEAEAKLTAIWEEVLELEQVGIHDDFFELGGHSLLAVRLISAIRKAFMAEMPIGDIFDYPTVALLSARLSAQSGTLVLPVIEKTKVRPEHIPLSFSQERLWFIDQLNGSVQYHIPAILKLKGELNVDALSNAIQQIINRHEVLRTVIVEEEGIGHQLVKEKNGWYLQTVDGPKYKDNIRGLQQYVKQFINLPFNLSEDYMLRAVLINLDEDEYVLVIVLHHIASDGWSGSIIVKELVELYNAYLENRTTSLATLPIQYADYALWQRKNLQGEPFDKKLNYWKAKLEGVTALQLPTDYPRNSVQSTKGAITQIKIDKSLSDQLGLLSRQQGATLFMTLLAVLKVFLYRYSGQRDICVGTPGAGRQQQEVEGLIGFFINTLALRNELAGETSFKDLLQQVKATTLEAYAHQEIPFEKVVESVVKNRDMSRSPLFQVMIVLQNTPEIGELRLGNVKLSRGIGEQQSHNTAKFELTFNFLETPEGLTLLVEYCTDLYKEVSIKRMMTHFTGLLNSVVKNADQCIGKLQMLTELESKQLLVGFNSNTTVYPASKTIVEIFEEQAKKYPSHVAIIFEGERLTYQLLNERTNRFARHLQNKGVKQGTMVPICIERGIDILIAILGVLKAGASYVPVDANYPSERIAFMLEDIAATLVLASKENRKKLSANKNIEIVEIDEDWQLIGRQSSKNLSVEIKPSDVAYVIYTSGSTGRPKGVMVTHGNVVSLVKGVDYVVLNNKRILLSTGSPSFDATTFEYWGMLLNGGSLVLCNDNRLLDSKLLKEEINSRGVNIMWFTAGWFNQLVETDISLFEKLETVLVGGEKLSEYHIGKLRQTFPGVKIINGYGPTENTTFSLTYSIMQPVVGQSIPIGHPLNNRCAMVLDENCQLVPIGVSGEIYLGGAGVSNGYLNQPELTKEKFLQNPFSENPGVKVYKTGDIGRWLSNGNIEFLGRKDEQVKVRGYRIELGEIETVLHQSELVSKAVVLAKQDKDGNNRLVAYVVPKDIFHKEPLLAFLKTRLPEYMVPAWLVKMKDFPLTPNGKVDRNALPDPDVKELLSNEFVAPRNELETKLANIWKEILLLDRVGIHDNFFEIGGHSLNAIRVAAVIRKRMDMDIFINDIFIHPTIEGLIGNFIEKIKNPSLPAVNIKYLVPVKSGGNKIPLYIMAGGGGTSLRFKKFSELLDPDQPVYVLQPPIDGKDLKEFPGTIEGIANKFIEEILILNPIGPYALSGYCIGGIIAFEMARQLAARGKKVHFLAMFDTILHKTIKKEPATLGNLYHIPRAVEKGISKLVLKVNFETFLLRKHTRQSIRYKVNSFRAFLDKINRKKLNPGEIEHIGMKIFDESSDSYVAAYKNYKLLPYGGDLVLFYAKEHYYFLDRDKNVGYKKLHLEESTKNLWRQYAVNTFIHEIEGEHSGIFDPVHGDKFAMVLQQYLNTPPI